MKHLLFPGNPPFVPDLRSNLPVHQGVARLLHGLLSGLRVNVRLILEQDVPESLHDYRVALRRTRTAMQYLEPNEPGGKWLRKLGRRTGPARDLDVLISKLSEIFDRWVETEIEETADTPSASCRDRGPVYQQLLARLKANRETEYTTVRLRLGSERYRSRFAEFEQTVDQIAARPGSDTFGAVVETGIQGAKDKLRRRIRAHRSAAGPRRLESVHRIRIQGKKLRYLLEFQRSAGERTDDPRLLEALRELQDRLGDLQDNRSHQVHFASTADSLDQSPTRALALTLATDLEHRVGDALQSVDPALETLSAALE